MLTNQNFTRGFLIDDEWMGSVVELETPGNTAPPTFLAYIVNHIDAEPVYSKTFSSLEEAITELNGFERSWIFESTKACGNGDCKKNASGICEIGGCGK